MSSLKGRLSKKVKKLGGKLPQVKAFKSVKGFFKVPEEEEGTRSEAAAQLIKQNVNKQAGGAQISYGEEKYV